MTKQEILFQLNKLQSAVNLLGMQHLADITPIELNKIEKELKPFAEIKLAIDKQVNKLEYEIISTKTQNSIDKIDNERILGRKYRDGIFKSKEENDTI